MLAKIKLSRDYAIGEVDRRIYGAFLEHLGRAVYGGVYEPGHESADSDGFREDVLALVRQLNMPIVRYPGGNFVSGYRFQDGIGPKELRPQRAELAWRTIETNQFGIDDFYKWAKKADTDVMLAVNLGTGTPQDAGDLVEYCNFEGGTYYSDLRKKHGFAEPFHVKTWCLGNEMDGNWQICTKTAEEYGRIACESAKIMKWVDPTIELVACGSSGLGMPTFGNWERIVLEHTYEYVDYISLHTYYGDYDNDPAAFLGRSVQMEQFIKSVAVVCDYVKAVKRSDKTLYLSFDEWNVWYHKGIREDDRGEPWQIAPAQLEDNYTFLDALVVGCMLNALLRNADRVKMACLAQLVNVIAPIMTETGGRVFAQTIFYPYFYASNYGKGKVLDAIVDCGSYDTKDVKGVPYLDSVCILNEEDDTLVVFAVNRSLDSDVTLSLQFSEQESLTLIEHAELCHADLNITNTADCPDAVVPVQKAVLADSDISLAPHSWNMLRFSLK